MRVYTGKQIQIIRQRADSKIRQWSGKARTVLEATSKDKVQKHKESQKPSKKNQQNNNKASVKSDTWN